MAQKHQRNIHELPEDPVSQAPFSSNADCCPRWSGAGSGGCVSQLEKVGVALKAPVRNARKATNLPEGTVENSLAPEKPRKGGRVKKVCFLFVAPEQLVYHVITAESATTILFRVTPCADSSTRAWFPSMHFQLGMFWILHSTIPATTYRPSRYRARSSCDQQPLCRSSLEGP